MWYILRSNLGLMLFQVKPAIEALMEYKPDPFKLDNKEDKCAVELADERGPAFTAIAVIMFHQGCSIHDHNRQEMLKLLAERKIIGDCTVSHQLLQSK